MDEKINVQEVVNTEIEVADEGIGNIKIAPDVVSSIAGVATMEIKGVASMHTSFAGGIADMFGSKKGQSKGVKVEITEQNVVIDLYIDVEYGVRIPELAWEIQENVKNNVETMTGLNAEKVNIHIEGVNFKKAEKDNEEKDEEVVEEAEIEEIPTEDESWL